MDFFNRNTPGYKRANASKAASAQPAAPTKLSSFFGSLFGGTSPIYKTADGRGAQASRSSGFWSLFTAAAPSYKTAPAMFNAPTDDIDSIDEIGVDEAAGLAEPTPCMPGVDEVVLL
jgi:hypothetical protein